MLRIGYNICTNFLGFLSYSDSGFEKKSHFLNLLNWNGKDPKPVAPHWNGQETAFCRRLGLRIEKNRTRESIKAILQCAEAHLINNTMWSTISVKRMFLHLSVTLQPCLAQWIKSHFMLIFSIIWDVICVVMALFSWKRGSLSGFVLLN